MQKGEWVWIKEAPSVLKQKYGISLSLGYLRRLKYEKKYPIFSKLGGKVFVDVHKILDILEENRQRDLEKWNRIFSIYIYHHDA
ncbi:hypothetical protein [Hippea alviniae]|uniref:hypothetical protein n=1 Tax=Hippea alviniae TaxID=1279027 RepID=UPI000527643C|nr:hypothetical protein [Hippea alviniae]